MNRICSLIVGGILFFAFSLFCQTTKDTNDIKSIFQNVKIGWEQKNIIAIKKCFFSLSDAQIGLYNNLFQFYDHFEVDIDIRDIVFQTPQMAGVKTKMTKKMYYADSNKKLQNNSVSDSVNYILAKKGDQWGILGVFYPDRTTGSAVVTEKDIDIYNSRISQVPAVARTNLYKNEYSIKSNYKLVYWKKEDNAAFYSISILKNDPTITSNASVVWKTTGIPLNKVTLPDSIYSELKKNITYFLDVKAFRLNNAVLSEQIIKIRRE